MLNLDDLMVFNTKKGGRNLKNRSGICFSISKNKKEYVGIKFYFAKNIAEKYGITDKVKIKFACSKVNLYQWFLIINDDGYTVRADANGNSFSCFMSYPFKFIDNKKLQFISENNIKFYEDKNIVSFSVVDVFKDNELILNED